MLRGAQYDKILKQKNIFGLKLNRQMFGVLSTPKYILPTPQLKGWSTPQYILPTPQLKGWFTPQNILPTPLLKAGLPPRISFLHPI